MSAAAIAGAGFDPLRDKTYQQQLQDAREGLRNAPVPWPEQNVINKTDEWFDCYTRWFNDFASDAALASSAGRETERTQ